MKIENNSVVTFNYSLSQDDGLEIENNHDTIPMAYLHGHSNILPALEEALSGRSLDESFTATLSPEQAYGPRNEAATQKAPVKHLAKTYKRLLPGMLVKLNTEKGVRDARVIKAGKFMVALDLNHPFAGKTLVFNITIKSIRAATEDEIQHGHAHGEGGHHH
ncbi:MAG: FKBP-type peptidyl-prolyl cis-trans isomerase SlyD [Lentisphaeria bacterium]|jgi:FKBP-type peptidyl-prolyl cis-trans isomerase SlyD